MTIEFIEIGALPNDGTGDPLRVAFEKINNNFSTIPLIAINGPVDAIIYKTGEGSSEGDANLKYDKANANVLMQSNIIPQTDNFVSIGAPDLTIANIWLNKHDSFHLGNVSISESANNVLNFYPTANNLLQADLQVGNIYSTGDIIAIGNVTSTGSISIVGGLNLGNILINSANVMTSNNDANQIVYSHVKEEITTMRIQITSVSTGTNDSQTALMTLNKRNDGLAVKYNVSGTIFNGTPLTRYNADVAFGNVRIMVSPIPNIEMYHIVSYFTDIN
jgi:hypothetical protein